MFCVFLNNIILRVGIFLLSHDLGLKEIGECSTSGFHPHTKVPPLFEVNASLKFIYIRQLS